MVLEQVEGEELVTGEGQVTQGAVGVVEAEVVHLQVAHQIVVAEALLWAEVAVVDGGHLPQEGVSNQVKIREKAGEILQREKFICIESCLSSGYEGFKRVQRM